MCGGVGGEPTEGDLRPTEGLLDKRERPTGIGVPPTEGTEPTEFELPGERVRAPEGKKAPPEGERRSWETRGCWPSPSESAS